MKQTNQDKISIWATFKVLMSYVVQEKKYLILGIIFSVLNCLFYVAGSFLIGQIVVKFFQPYTGENALPISQFNNVSFAVWLVSLTVLFLLYGLFRYLEQKFFVQVAFNAAARLRQQLIEKIFKLPVSFYDNNKTGNLISALIVDVNNVANSLFQILGESIRSIFNIIISMLFLITISGLLSLIVIPVSLFMFLLVFLLIKNHNLTLLEFKIHSDNLTDLLKRC
ncbi:ABC transporter transmembrane domain-containing protein [Mycoplasma nasistruthionis]|uniref:ABC transporter ATP-binding protein n=1 Tax=Mycoplasma nasistruthionis TaxID=353852 RepID=A0A5B7XUA1_9MOLU|nr:ABC transporter transmembrane domain-containing protein [Mycoplasma nasistruthionis]QCZ36438.1 ABC transporter ATP-binding protein [Mycoplasma nasistruthionis]